MSTPEKDRKLAEALVLDEIFDLSLYRALRPLARGHLQATLDELIPIETKHAAFWQEFFKVKIEKLNFTRRVKLAWIVAACRVFGETAMYLVLEAIEVYGIRKYLRLWRAYEGTPLAEAVRVTLEDEFRHEDEVVSGYAAKKISPERIRSVFLGFNDGLVEFLGAVSGFFAAFQTAGHVLVASLTGAAAGALSMAVGVYISSGSEKEVEQMTLEKERFLKGKKSGACAAGDDPIRLALIVGVFYFIGAMFPILPICFGAKNVALSWAFGGGALILVTATLSFLSGMKLGRRVLTNAALVSVAVGSAYLFGVGVKRVFGVAVP